MTGKTEKGFTLAETAMVVLLVAVLAAIAAPAYQGYMAKSRLNGAARMVYSDLMAARMKAVKTNQRVRVFFYTDRYGIWNDADGNGRVDDNEGDDLLRSLVPHYPGITISNKTGDPLFLPKGTVTDLSTITVTNAAGHRDIVVSMAGRVRIDSN